MFSLMTVKRFETVLANERAFWDGLFSSDRRRTEIFIEHLKRKTEELQENVERKIEQRIRVAFKEFTTTFDARGAKGDYDQLRQDILLLREKVFGENTQFCRHGVTPRLCDECTPLEGKFWGPPCGEFVEILEDTMPCRLSKGHDGAHVFEKISATKFCKESGCMQHLDHEGLCG